MAGVHNLPIFFEYLQHSRFVVAINSSVPTASALEVIHYLSFFLLTGLLVFLDLRILGLAGRRLPIKVLARQAFPWVWTGFTLATLSGFLMFAADATEYVGNSIFHRKLLAFLVGVTLAAFLQWRIPIWDRELTTPPVAKILAVASLLASVGTILLGVDVPALTGVG